MKKIMIGLLALTSLSAFAGTEVALSKYLSLSADSVESIGDATKYNGISVADSLNNKVWLLDNATNSPKAICRTLGHQKSIAFEVQDIRNDDFLGRATGSKKATCKLNYIDFDLFKTFEHGELPVSKEHCNFDAGTDKTNYAYSSVTCV